MVEGIKERQINTKVSSITHLRLFLKVLDETALVLEYEIGGRGKQDKDVSKLLFMFHTVLTQKNLNFAAILQ